MASQESNSVISSATGAAAAAASDPSAASRASETSQQSAASPAAREINPGAVPQRGRDSGRGNYKSKKRDMGRNAWSKQKPDKRQENDARQANKRRRLVDDEDERGVTDQPVPIYATVFTEQELAAEERRPKKKVAVMIGYSGTGYKGMQFTNDQKTIEGDLFKAFVAAGAISKANADDPRKSSFVRCARTDKGVHAAGNVISLKLIVEDEDIVEKINSHLAPQIRVWGLERTANSFSAYQMVDSRIYEYLIPTHSFLPPHPSTWLGKKCAEWAERKGDMDAWKERQTEVEGFWEQVDEDKIKPILDEYDEEIRGLLKKALYLQIEDENAGIRDEDDAGQKENSMNADAAAEPVVQPPSEVAVQGSTEEREAQQKVFPANDHTNHDDGPGNDQNITGRHRREILSEAGKKLRQAYIQAKRSYRIDPVRLNRLVKTLDMYTGTKNYHNYTIAKTFHDPSAKRHIKSFQVNPQPILINGSEWLSLKVHGQSFMMHQIRKMVAMAALVVRCGTDPAVLMPTSFGPTSISIPKAPSLGLLLERPIFETYNNRVSKESRPAIAFTKYESQISRFKTEAIYTKIYADEERDNIFGNFFAHVDNFPSETFLFLTSGGVEAIDEKAPGSRDVASKATAPAKATTATTHEGAALGTGSSSSVPGHKQGRSDTSTADKVNGNQPKDLDDSDSDSDIEAIKDGAGNEG